MSCPLLSNRMNLLSSLNHRLSGIAFQEIDLMLENIYSIFQRSDIIPAIMAFFEDLANLTISWTKQACTQMILKITIIDHFVTSSMCTSNSKSIEIGSQVISQLDYGGSKSEWSIG